MNILEKIVQDKRREVGELKKRTKIDEFRRLPSFRSGRPSFYDALIKSEPSIIAEFKRKSPSKGLINASAKVEDIVPGYEKAGASAVSILTDIHFNGKSEDIQQVCHSIGIPVLRKDFIIDELQVFEARALGASAILLIAAILTKQEIEFLTNIAQDLELDVLLELHEETELDKVPGNIKIVGINNRDLKTFRVDLERSVLMAKKLPEGIIKVSESGIGSVETLMDLYFSGFQAFLIGENFMKEKNPDEAAGNFIRQIKERMAARESR